MRPNSNSAVTASGGRMPSGLSHSARAVSAQTISAAGRPQNKAESPRASRPSERSSSASGDVIGEMMKEE